MLVHRRISTLRSPLVKGDNNEWETPLLDPFLISYLVFLSRSIIYYYIDWTLNFPDLSVSLCCLQMRAQGFFSVLLFPFEFAFHFLLRILLIDDLEMA